MARSARQPKKGARSKQRPGMLQAGTAALGEAIANNPVLVGGSTAFLVTLFYVSANALWYQPGLHAGAFFATRSYQHFPVPTQVEPETTINIERPEPQASAGQDTTSPAAVVAKSDPIVQRVQSVLKDIGYYDGTLDGLTGPATRKAIEAYRQKMGLPVSGNIDEALLDQLGIASTTASVVPQPAPRSEVSGAVARQPATNAAQDQQKLNARIVKIQAGLRAFGNNDIKTDGVIGGRTKSAIREFQALFGLPETGEPDEAVYAKMREIGLTN
ncbi:peptidoglycan-binding protein [Mesorhizobium sp. 1M-11]|uniref:peptidoglycan-binding protein n=1 Tax=Mesorhizobium sp. 1M-11 TaxID=1529006 RepID=UPI0006C760BC|nr:peptidoglycan-binding protein [Mesorhizobium sp. 1M-11]